MAITSTKNQPLSTAYADLGLGDTLPTQVQDALEAERKKKALLGTQSSTSLAAQQLGIGSSSSFSAMG